MISLFNLDLYLILIIPYYSACHFSLRKKKRKPYLHGCKDFLKRSFNSFAIEILVQGFSLKGAL